MIENTKKINTLCMLCKKYDKSSNPFILQCSHLLCLNCLQDYLSNIHSNYIECPSCKKQTSLDFFEKELDDFTSTSGTPQSNQNISDNEYIKQQQKRNQAYQQQQQLMLNKNLIKNQKMEDYSKNGQYKRSQSNHQQQNLNQINVYQDYYVEKQEISKGSNYKQGQSVSNNQFTNDPNSSNGMFLNSFEISSILPHPNQEQNCINNYSSPVFTQIQSSYTTPLDLLIANDTNVTNDTQKLRVNNELVIADDNDYSQQLAEENIIQETLINSNKNSILNQEKQIVNQNNQTSNSSNSYNRLQTTQSKNSESLYSRSNSSAGNLFTLQNNINNNSLIPNNNVIQTANVNYQNNPANQSFSQSFIQPIQQSFVSVSGIKCKAHPDEEANLFCFQCHDNCMCINCFLQSGEHKEHEVKNVRNSFNQLVPLVQNLKERINLQVSDLKNDESLIVNRQNDIRNLCSETLTHLNKQVKEIITLIAQKGEVLSKEIEIFQQEQLNELQKKYEKINKQLVNLNTFSDSYDKILNFQGKCSEARMFNYFSDTKSKVNKYISKLQKQNEEIRNACRTKYTSCYPEHIFNEIELQIQNISIPFTISQPFSLPTTNQLPSSPNQQLMMQTPNNNTSNNINKNSGFFQPQQISHPQQKRFSMHFDDKSLKESKILDFEQIKSNSGQIQLDQINNQSNSSFTPLNNKMSNSAVRYHKQPRDSRMNSGHNYNANMMNNSNFYDQNYYQNSIIKINRVSNNVQEPLMERNVMFQDNSANKTSKPFFDLKQRLDTNDQDQENQQQQQISNNPFNLKSTQFQFNNQTKNNIVKLKLQEMPIILPPEIQTSDSFIIQNPSNKSLKSTNRAQQNNENLFESIPVTSVKECVQLIKNTLKSRGASHSQLRERTSQNPPIINEPYRYKSNLKENRYSVPKLDTKKIEQLLTGATLTQKSTERERIGKSNDKKIRELKKILNEGW